MKIEGIILAVVATLSVLKIAGEIAMPWWKIFLVLCFPLVLLLALGIIGGVIAIIHGNTKNKSN